MNSCLIKWWNSERSINIGLHGKFESGTKTYKRFSHGHLGDAAATCRVYREENCQSLWSDLWWTSQSMKLWRWPLNAWPETFQIFRVIWNRLSSFVIFPTEFLCFSTDTLEGACRQTAGHLSHLHQVGQVCLPANPLVHSEITILQIKL